ncbi:MAG: hypothetical protein ACTHMY_18050 [Solirubrobacteraceae bacterium]
MSQRARDVLHAIDVAAATRERHPTLFARQLRADRNCLQLQRAVDRYRRMREPPARRDRYVGDEGAERVDLDWEEKQARKRAERWLAAKPNALAGALPHHRAETKPGLDRDRRAARHGLDAHQLYRLAIARAARISTVRAGNVAASSAGSGHPSKNLAVDHSGAQTLEDDPRWGRHWGFVKAGLLLVHELLDEAEGHGTQTDMTSEAMNRLILEEGRGLSCREVAEKFPEATAGGKASIVARVRRNQGSGLYGLDESGRKVGECLDLLGSKVNVSDGLPQMDTAAPGVRRVAIEPPPGVAPPSSTILPGF